MRVLMFGEYSVLSADLRSGPSGPPHSDYVLRLPAQAALPARAYLPLLSKAWQSLDYARPRLFPRPHGAYVPDRLPFEPLGRIHVRVPAFGCWRQTRPGDRA